MKKIQILILLCLVFKLNSLVTTKDLITYSHAEYDKIVSLKNTHGDTLIDKYVYSMLDEYFKSVDEYYNSIDAINQATHTYEQSLLSLNSIKLSLMEKLEEQYKHKLDEEHAAFHQAEEKKNLDHKNMSDLKKLCQTYKLNKEQLREKLLSSLYQLFDTKNIYDENFLNATSSWNTMNSYNDTRIEDNEAKDTLRKELDQLVMDLNNINSQFMLSEDKLNKAYKANAVNFSTWQSLQYKKDMAFIALETAWNELEKSHESWSKKKFEKNKLNYLKSVTQFETISKDKHKYSSEIYHNLIAIKSAEKEYFELNLGVLARESLIKGIKLKLMEYK
ncbi:hypothetical protein [Borrelia sp. RT1S]|uniref:hypothetical protein n=1 Tax=Borrelia sp. RT1S TaxID=2898580 RepID=UPI001E5A49E1|nr:hypothetical protein [Borrelia sp. RT1S]UGQ18023.1 hypothetical protein LSO05_06200 [Borrelia sp. RT1S]